MKPNAPPPPGPVEANAGGPQGLLRRELLISLYDAATDPGRSEELAARFLAVLGETATLAAAAVWVARDGRSGDDLRLLAYWSRQGKAVKLPQPTRLPRKTTPRPIPLPGCVGELAFGLGAEGVLWMSTESPAHVRAVTADDDLARILTRFAGTLDRGLVLNRALRKLDDTAASQRQFRETAVRLETLVESLDGAVLLETERRTIALANDAFCRIFGVPSRPQDLIGADCALAMVGARRLFRDPDAFLVGVELALAGSKPVVGEVLELLDGRVLERDYLPIWADGHPAGHLWHFRDVTVREHAAREIARLKQFYEQLLDALPVELAVFAPDGSYLHATSSAIPDAKLRSWALGRNDVELAAERGGSSRLAEARMSRLREVAATGRPATVEESLRDREGRSRSVLRFNHPLCDASGQVVQVLRYGLELTERKRAEAALAASEARKAAVLDAALDAVITFDSGGRIVELNRAAERIFGQTSEQLMQLRLADLVEVDELGAAPVADPRMLFVTGEQNLFGQRVEVLGRRADGSRFPAELAARPLRLADGTELVTAYVRDITAWRDAEDNLRAARRAAEVSAHAKEQFLANMSHEIRTPLNAVIGMTHLLAGTAVDGEQSRYLQAIQFSADTLLALLNGILDLSKIGAGRIEFEAIPFDLVELLEGLVASQRGGAEQRQLALTLAVDPTVPRVVVGDPMRLKQILFNLVGNALKFTEQGGVVLTVERGEQADQRLELRFIVSDSGIGIAPEQLMSIFEPFTQERADTARRHGGTGLGLTIVRELVERQGGAIAVHSVLGRGSRFTVRLSWGLVDAAMAAATRERRVTGSPLVGVRILLVEDNEVNQLVAGQLLQRVGAEVVVAGDGVEALDRLRESRFDVVLMDIQMPNMDGFEATRRIRAELGLGRDVLPVIALTASALLEQRGEAIDAGMDDFVMKPFHPRQLEEVLAAHLVRVRRDQALAATGPPATTEVPAFPLEEAPPIDLEHLAAQAGRQPDLARDLLDLFMSQAPGLGSALERALAGGRRDELAGIAHKLRSSAGVVGAHSLRETLTRLERGAKCGRPLSELATEVTAASWQIARAVNALGAVRDRFFG